MGKELNDMLIKLIAGDKANPTTREAAATTIQERKIVFHSWRHLFAKMMTDRADPNKVKILTGHKDNIMLAHYADHQYKADFLAISKVVQEAFSPISKTIEADELIARSS